MKLPFLGRNDPDPEEEPQVGNDEVLNDLPEMDEGGIESSEPYATASDILSYFADYPEKRVRPEFSELGKMVIDPAPLMGYADGTDVAQIINLLSVQRLHYMAVPECLKGDSYMVFDLFVAIAKPMVNLAKHGRLVQAMTRYKMEADIPDYFVAYMLRQKELEKELELARRNERGGGALL